MFTGHANRNERVLGYLQTNPLGLGRTFVQMLLCLLCRCCETDQETTAIEKIACYSHFPRGGGRRHPAEPHGEAHQVYKEAEGAREGMGRWP